MTREQMDKRLQQIKKKIATEGHTMSPDEYDVVQIMPSVWQKRLLTKANVERRVLKRMSVKQAEMRWGVKCSHDVADAINIATWKYNELQWEAKCKAE